MIIMGDRSGFTWQTVPEFNYIDGLVYGKLKELKILPSELCNDNDFIRRLYIDITGLPPEPDAVRAFRADHPAAPIVIALTAQVHAPQPPASAAVAPAATSASAGGVDAIPPAPGSSPAQSQMAAGAVPPLPAAEPTHLTVPAIGVSSDLLQLGLNPDNTLQVPPLSKNSQAGWYRSSPSPGQLGPARVQRPQQPGLQQLRDPGCDGLSHRRRHPELLGLR